LQISRSISDVWRRCEDEIATHLASESPDATVPNGLVALLYEHTEGNPLFIVAALDHMTQRGFLSREKGSMELDRFESLCEHRRACAPWPICGSMLPAMEHLGQARM
jgi:hypothetical protein